MTSEKLGLVSTQRLDDGLNPQMAFQDEGLHFGCGPPQRRIPAGDDSIPKSTARDKLPGFIESHFFQPQAAADASDFRGSVFHDASVDRRDHNWSVDGRCSSTPSRDGSVGEGDDEDDEDQDDDDDEEDDENEDRLVAMEDAGNKNINVNSCDNSSVADKSCNGKLDGLTSFVDQLGLKESNIIHSGNDNATVDDSNDNQRSVGHYQNSGLIEGQLYHRQYIQAQEASTSGQKDRVFGNGCGFSGRNETPYMGDSGESLRTILSDPLTGTLMDDAMILPCGHSFGGGGIQHVIRTKTCYSCSQPVSEDSVAPNLSLRLVVQAYCREEELLASRGSKRRREIYEQDKGSYNDLVLMDHSRAKGVQFPFSVSDRVIIKGNKRTPQRFVGREAVVTSQCLNGWYVVKTLDNAESVKLQYRSLAKVGDDQSSKPTSSKVTPNWLSGSVYVNNS